MGINANKIWLVCSVSQFVLSRILISNIMDKLSFILRLHQITNYFSYFTFSNLPVVTTNQIYANAPYWFIGFLPSASVTLTIPKVWRVILAIGPAITAIYFTIVEPKSHYGAAVIAALARTSEGIIWPTTRFQFVMGCVPTKTTSPGLSSKRVARRKLAAFVASRCRAVIELKLVVLDGPLRT